MSDYSIEEVIDAFVFNYQTQFDVSTALDISERINKSKKEMKNALEQLRKHFKHTDSSIVLQAVLLFESLIKNCAERIHYEASIKQFQETFMKLLRYKRDKANVFEKILAKEKNWRQIEDKVLYIYQLWADTFMMHEDDFPLIMTNYKKLRQEGVKFPPRDTSEKFMISFKGTKSPIFDVIEDISRREQLEDQKRKENQRKFNEQQQRKAQSALGGNKNYIDTDVLKKNQQSNKLQMDDYEVDQMRDNMQLLVALMENAQTSEELNTDFSQEVKKQMTEKKDKISLVYKQKNFKDENQKRSCIELYQSSKKLLKNFEERLEELIELDQAMQMSMVDEVKKEKMQKNLQKLKQFKPDYPGKPSSNKKNNQEESKDDQYKREQNEPDDIDLLDMDWEDPNQNNKKPEQHQSNMTPQNPPDQYFTQSSIQLQQNQDIIQQQNQNISFQQQIPIQYPQNLQPQQNYQQQTQYPYQQFMNMNLNQNPQQIQQNYPYQNTQPSQQFTQQPQIVQQTQQPLQQNIQQIPELKQPIQQQINPPQKFILAPPGQTQKNQQPQIQNVQEQKPKNQQTEDLLDLM